MPDLKYSINYNQKELNEMYRHRLIFNAQMIRTLLLSSFVVAGAILTMSIDSKLILIAFCGYMILLSFGLIYGVYNRSRSIKIYNLSLYPMDYAFSENGVSIKCKNGVFMGFPWIQVKKIIKNKDCVYLATRFGEYLLKTDQMSDDDWLQIKHWKGALKK